MSHASKLIAVGLTAMTLGCASMCDSSLDCDFHAYGGVRDRLDRVDGRVESIFDPATTIAAVVPTQEPLPTDVMDSSDGSTTGETGDGMNEDGSVEDSGLAEELIDELEEMDKLPKVPAIDGSDEDELDDAESLFNEI